MTRITTLTHLVDENDSGQSETIKHSAHQGQELARRPESGQADRLELLLGVYDTLLDRFMPPMILVDATRRVIDTFSGADRFLRFGARRPSEDVLELLVDPFRAPVAKAFALCCSTGQSVLTEPIALASATDPSDAFPSVPRSGGDRDSAILGVHNYCVRITPVPHRNGDSPFFSIAIEEAHCFDGRRDGAGNGPAVSAPGLNYAVSRSYVDFARQSPSLVCESSSKGFSEDSSGQIRHSWSDWDGLFESSGLAVIFLDADLRICHFTGPAGVIFGLLPHDVGRRMETFAGNLESSDLIDRLTQSVRTRDPDEFEIHQPKKGGYYLARIVPLRGASAAPEKRQADSAGMPADPQTPGRELVALTLIDLSSLDPKRQEADRLSSIVQSSADAIISRDCEDRIVTWNAAAEQLYGYSAGEAIGQPIGLIIPADETEEHENSLRVLRRDAHENHFDASRKTKRGDHLRVSVRLSPIFDEEHRIIGISTIERDISAKAAMADQLSQSEKMLQAFYDQSPEMCCSLDAASGLITGCNDSMCLQLGMTREEIIGRSIIELQSEGARDSAIHCLERLRTAGMLHGNELELRRKCGGTIPVSLCATAIYDRTGTIVGGRAIWRDLTQLRVKDELIHQGEARFRNSFQNSAIGIAHCDLEGRYLLANRRLCEIVGYSFEELSQKTFAGITHPEDLHQEIELRRRLIAAEIETYKLEKRYIHQTGREVWVSVFVSLDRDASGSPVACHSYIEDISARKELENELRSAIRQRDQFLAMLSHELRNPLGAILNTCAVLSRRKNFAKNLQNAVSIVTRQARQMAELLDDLLDVSRITTGKIKLEKAPIDLAQVADEAVESQQALAASRGQRLAVTYCDEPLLVFGDRSRLVQVVVNLLNNAIKYTGDGGLISVMLEKQGRVGRIRVKDNGVGLEPEQIESLFEMFAQKDATLDRSGGGMGLGLHLVRKLVDFHSGRVLGRSEGLGKGSEFIVELPLSTRRPSGPQPVPSSRPAARSKIKRIVVVEDIDDARKMLVALLEADNYQVYSAADGEAGLQMILREKPDLAIVDIGLPKLDGYEVARRVRIQIPSSETRLVALTGYGQDSDHENVMRAGFDTHLVKPLNHTRLEKILAGM
jgi:PAS domain S-box-containing protein